MSEQEEQEQAGTGGHTGAAVTAVASMAAAAAATYAVRKAFSRNAGTDDSTEEEDEEETEARADAEYDEGAPEDSAEAYDDDEYDDGEEPQPRDADGSRSSAATSKLRSVGSGALASASQALVPLAEQAAVAAGRYTAENAPDAGRDNLVPRFIAGFGEAS